VTYENRLPINYAFGQLTGAAAISDTTLTSTDFATGLSTGLSTTNYVPMTLQDPSTKLYEIVWVNAHTASASTCTVVRGKEGTSARAWGTGTLWTVAPTLRDGVLPVANRAALPADPHVGLRAFIQDEQVVVERTLTSWAASPNTTIIARGTRTTVSTLTTTIVGVLRLDSIVVYSGRSYRFTVNCMGPKSTVALDTVLTELRYSTSGAATTSSTVMPGGQGYFKEPANDSATTFVMAPTYDPPANQTLSVLLTVSRALGTGNISMYADASHMLQISVDDIGVAVANTGVVI